MDVKQAIYAMAGMRNRADLKICDEQDRVLAVRGYDEDTETYADWVEFDPDLAERLSHILAE